MQLVAVADIKEGVAQASQESQLGRKNPNTDRDKDRLPIVC